MVSVAASASLDELQRALQQMPTGAFEALGAALIGRLLGLDIAVARSGFQHGGDAGPAGRGGRRFRLECKRYADNTHLSDRELLGEIDHALLLDPALEAWFLMATRPASEQLELSLLRKSDETGVPIVVIDWKRTGFPALAALCTAGPDLLDLQVSARAGALARALEADASDARAALARDLQAWQLGFARLRESLAEHLRAVWSTPRIAVAAIGQDAAGGAYPTTISRAATCAALNAWWDGPALHDAPGIVTGWQGAGKTWAVMHWLVDRLADQPLVLFIPSRAVGGFASISKPALKRFLGERLAEIAGARDAQHWQMRLERLLRRPSGEGPLLTLVLDGMNEAPAAPWLDILKLLQDPEFAGRVRVVAITRNLHFTERLARLQGLAVAPHVIEVGNFDLAPGGEFDQRLIGEGLTREDLEGLVELACVPRLFNLVVRLRGRLGERSQVTVHRLLWEYGRDTLGGTGRAMSEGEWRAWLGRVAQDRIEGIKRYNLQMIGMRVERPDLEASAVFTRLSDIVDGFAHQPRPGQFELSATLVSHALGAALLEHLAGSEDREQLDQLLTSWLDPIAGLDEKTEILRAAVSIELAADPLARPAVLTTLLDAWVNAQNFPESHGGELARLAVPLCGPLLDLAEHASGSALHRVVDALCAIPRNEREAAERIMRGITAWLHVISRDVDPPARRHDDAERSRSEQLLKRIGTDRDGPVTVLGHAIELVERRHRAADKLIPALLEGFALVRALDLFEAAALTVAVRGRQDFWDGLKWLCLLNQRDFAETAAALRARADVVSALTPEPHVHPELKERVASLLLWLSADEDNEALAGARTPALERHSDYARDYLPDPAASLFALEARHAAMSLLRTDIRLERRIERAGRYLADPGFVPPPQLAAELDAALVTFDDAELDRGLFHSAADHVWVTLLPGLARVMPDLLARRIRSRLCRLGERSGEALIFAAIRASNAFLLGDEGVRAAAGNARLALGRLPARILARELSHEAENDGQAPGKPVARADAAGPPQPVAPTGAASAPLAGAMRPADGRGRGDDAAQDGSARSSEYELSQAPLRRAGQYIDSAAAVLLQFEIARLSAREQVERLLDAGLAHVYVEHGELIAPLSPSDVDMLLTQCEAAPHRRLAQLLILLRLVGAQLSELAWTRIAAIAFDPGHAGRGAAFELLERHDAARFGRALHAASWHWRHGEGLWCNHHGSLALAAASTGLPFDQLAPRIAPWLLPRAVVLRGGSAADAQLAATLLDALVADPQRSAPDPGSDITINVERAERDPGALSLRARPDLNPARHFADTFDPAKREAAHNRGLDTALTRIEEARAGGAQLYLRFIPARDLAPLLDGAGDWLERWLEGVDGPSADFERRVRLSESFWLALCEALLDSRPARGAQLWHALRATLSTRFIDSAGVDRLTRLAFEIGNAPADLRERLLDLEAAPTDLALFELALAAQLSGERGWLEGAIDRDAGSGATWRARRARVLRGFLCHAGDEVPPWPQGEVETARDGRERTMHDHLRRDAFAQHWWRLYWSAEREEEAFAAWQLLLRTVDRRWHVWQHDAMDPAKPRRLAHFRLNFDALESAMAKQEKNFDSEFLGWRVVSGVGPWPRQ